MSPTPALLVAELEKSGCSCPSAALEPLCTYLSMLMRWNRKMNLVGAHTWQEAASDLVADCLRLADFLDTLPLPEDPLCWDPGAGAGLPGIPLRTVWTRGSYHMIEVRSKRALFLAQVLGTLSLPRTHVHNQNVQSFWGSALADLVVSRAFLPWEEVITLLADHVAEGGHIVFMSRMIPEASDLAKVHAGFELAASTSYEGPSGTRTLWAVRKDQARASA